MIIGGLILIVLSIVGIVAYKFLKKPKLPSAPESTVTVEETSDTTRLSSTTFLKGMADDDELRSVQ